MLLKAILDSYRKESQVLLVPVAVPMCGNNPAACQRAQESLCSLRCFSQCGPTGISSSGVTSSIFVSPSLRTFGAPGSTV